MLLVGRGRLSRCIDAKQKSLTLKNDILCNFKFLLQAGNLCKELHELVSRDAEKGQKNGQRQRINSSKQKSIVVRNLEIRKKIPDDRHEVIFQLSRACPTCS